jgi:tetratricopeptide (TPR) repeat protein
MAGSKKFSKGNLKKVFIVIIALMLIGGLVLSATFGFIDFLLERKNLASPGEDEELRYLKEKAHYLEESIRESPDLESKADLGSTYYNLALYYYWDLDWENAILFSQKGSGFLLEALDGGLTDSSIALKAAVLFLMQEDDPQAERYFRKALELDEENAEAHLYLGNILSSRGLDDQAKVHWERVLELVEEDSPEAQAARYYLQAYEIEDISGEKGEDKP